MNISIFVYRLNQLLNELDHQCNVTLTEVRPTIYNFEADCLLCAMKINFSAETIDRLYTRVGKVDRCK